MSLRAPRLKAPEIIRILERNGFEQARSSGSHRIFKNAEGVRVTVPFHVKKTLHPKVLSSILRDAKWTVDFLIEEYKK